MPVCCKGQVILPDHYDWCSRATQACFLQQGGILTHTHLFIPSYNQGNRTHNISSFDSLVKHFVFKVGVGKDISEITGIFLLGIDVSS